MSVRTILTALALSPLLLAAGCATLIDGGPSRVEATSTPAGAQVVALGVDNGERLTGTTPTSFTLDKSSDYELTFSLDGYASESIMVRRTVNGWFFGNFFLGLVPMVVDAATHNIWSHTIQVASVDFTSARHRPDGSLTADVIVRTVAAEHEPIVARVPVIFHRTAM